MRKVIAESELYSDSSIIKGEEVKNEVSMEENEEDNEEEIKILREHPRRATAAHFSLEALRFVEIHGIFYLF